MSDLPAWFASERMRFRTGSFLGVIRTAAARRSGSGPDIGCSPFYTIPGATPHDNIKRWALALACQRAVYHFSHSRPMSPYAKEIESYAEVEPADAQFSRTIHGDRPSIRVILPTLGWEYSDGNFIGRGALRSRDSDEFEHTGNILVG